MYVNTREIQKQRANRLKDDTDRGANICKEILWSELGSKEN